MLPGHRNKAIVGVGLWLIIFMGFFGLLIATRNDKAESTTDSTLGTLWLIGLAIQILVAPWASYHLAKGKGYAGGLALLGLIPCVQAILLTVLAVLPDHHARKKATAGPRSRRYSDSPISRIVRYRRNALIGNAFGLFGILMGISLVLIPIGYTEDPETETVVGMFVFLFGYSGVITGCWWWAKAKGWPDGIVFIGLLPLAILFVPWVRLIFVAAPLLLPTSMVMMPLILLVIMFVLPDKSGVTKRHR